MWGVCPSGRSRASSTGDFMPPRRSCNARVVRCGVPTRRLRRMLDPLDALLRGPERVAPRPEFEREVLARVRDDLRRSIVRVRSAPDDRAAGDSVNAYDVIDEALEMLRGTGPEFDPFGMGF